MDGDIGKRWLASGDKEEVEEVFLDGGEAAAMSARRCSDCRGALVVAEEVLFDVVTGTTTAAGSSVAPQLGHGAATWPSSTSTRF